MTSAGHAALKEELKRLKSEERPKVIAAIAEARDHGDLSENAEYDAAKEKQGFIEARIAEIEGKLARAQVIDVSTLSGERVIFGATVTIVDVDTEKEDVWTIVGDDESDLKARRIGVSSPIARALIGKEVGEEAEIRTPGGVKTAEVTDVTFDG
jgi:transcription elongation factor GreA